MRRKRGLCLLLAASMALSSSFTALAADKKIDTVKLSFSYSKAPESGDEIGDITVKAGSSGFEVDSAEYTNIEDQDTWTVGDIPEVKVELSAKDGYKFSYTSKSHFSLSGCNADFKKAKIYDDGQYIEVYAELKRIGGKLQGASELEWNDTTAEWEEIEGAKSYDVKLLRDDKTVTTVSTTGTSYNFAGYFNREGDYTFRVRAISRYNNKTGEWSEDSSSLYIDEDELGRYGGSGHWEQDGTGVWYAYDTGGYPASYPKGLEITGLDENGQIPGVTVYHAGTALKDGKLVTSGGRVLGVTALGKTLDEALEKAYAGVEKIHFDGAHYRRDIGRTK